MPQQIIVTGNGHTTIVPTGPVGPPGPPGTAGTPGLPGTADLQLDLELITMMELGSAEMDLVSVTRRNDGEIVAGWMAKRVDLSPIGQPSDVTMIFPFARDPARDVYIVEMRTISDDSPSEIFYATLPDIAASTMFSAFGGTPDTLLMSGTPIFSNHVATKGFVETLVAESLTATFLNARPTHVYGRNLGGRWAIVGGPGHYSTPDVGPLNREGIRFRSRVKMMRGAAWAAGGIIHFLELLTQFRNVNGHEFDQDNLEIALTLEQSVVGFFLEYCLISTPAPEPSGEYAAGRVFTEVPDSTPPEHSTVALTIGDAIDFRLDFIYNRGDGRWEVMCYIRTDFFGYDPAAGDVYENLDPQVRMTAAEWSAMNIGSTDGGEDFYWKRIKYVLGPEGQIGSIYDAGYAFKVGLGGGQTGVEHAWLSHIDSTLTEGDALGGPHPEGEELILDFQSKDIDPDTGLGTSLLVTGQVFTPHVIKDDSDSGVILPVIDDSAWGMWTNEQRLRALEP